MHRNSRQDSALEQDVARVSSSKERQVQVSVFLTHPSSLSAHSHSLK